jgi:hypothetical protein
MDDNLKSIFLVGAGVIVSQIITLIRDIIASRSKRVIVEADKVVAATQSEASKLLANAEIEIREAKLRLDAQQMIQEESRYLRTLIDEQNSNLALKDEKIAGLVIQQDKNIANIKSLEEKAKERHEQIDQQTAREAALNSTINDLQQELLQCKTQVEELKASINPNQ